MLSLTKCIFLVLVVACWQLDGKGSSTALKDSISGKPCNTLLDCRNVADKFPSTAHKCSDGVCIKFFTPGQFGCSEDSQCNVTCRESHCDGNGQCVCNSQDGQPMFLYANKCWKECPSYGLLRKYLVPTQDGNIWVCRDHSVGAFASRWESITRHKRQSRFFC